MKNKYEIRYNNKKIDEFEADDVHQAYQILKHNIHIQTKKEAKIEVRIFE